MKAPSFPSTNNKIVVCARVTSKKTVQFLSVKPLLLVFALFAACASPLQAIGLYEAQSTGKLSVSAVSSSGYNETKLVVRTLVPYAIDVDFSTACVAQYNGSQRIGLSYEKKTGKYFLRLAGNTTYTLFFQSRCLDSGRAAPSTGSSFDTILDISGWAPVVKALRENYNQSSVWRVTNSTPGWTASHPYSSGNNGGGSDSGDSGDLEISGSCSWSTSGRTININAEKVSNNSTSRTSGTLRLRIWATRSAYTGGNISGYVMGTRPLGQLQPNQYYANISGSVSHTRPPRGTYFTTITLEEYDGSGYVIVDYLNFSGTSRF